MIITYRTRAIDATFYKNRFQHDRFGVTNEICVGPFYLQISLLSRKLKTPRISDANCSVVQCSYGIHIARLHVLMDGLI